MCVDAFAWCKIYSKISLYADFENLDPQGRIQKKIEEGFTGWDQGNI